MSYENEYTPSYSKYPEYLPVPNSAIRLYEGNVVMFKTRPKEEWVVRNGYYEYEDKPYKGWYFTNARTEAVLPVYIRDLKTAVVISDTINKHCPHPHPHPHPCPPIPPGPEIAIFTVEDKENLDRAFITVDNMEALNNIDTEDLPDGKLVKVNDIGSGEAAFFTWSKTSGEWVPFNIATLDDITALLDEYKIKDLEIEGEGDYVTGITLDELTGNLKVYTDDIEDKINEVVMGNPNIAKIEDIPVWSVI